MSKWTNAVIAIAIATGKKIAMIGINKVPKPKPENKVSREARYAVMTITTAIIVLLPYFSIQFLKIYLHLDMDHGLLDETLGGMH